LDIRRTVSETMMRDARSKRVAFIVEAPVAFARGLAARARGAERAAQTFLDAAAADAERAGALVVVERIRGTASPPGAAPLTFQREGEFWTVCGAGATVRLKDSRGM